MKRLLVSSILALLFLTIHEKALARGSSADLNLLSPQTSAVDIKGVRHRGSEYRGKTPWLTDVVRSMAPFYPYEERRLRHTGIGWFRIDLDPNTGFVTQINVLKSTGFSGLDNSAVVALRHWRWKPGRWREVDMPVTFKLGADSNPPPAGSVRLPPY